MLHQRASLSYMQHDLRAMGLPILMEDPPGADPPVVGYRITDADYGMDDPELNTDELAALHLATPTVVARSRRRFGPLKLGGASQAAPPACSPVCRGAHPEGVCRCSAR